VGWSDHTLGVETALAAVARGASVVEKHMTSDRNLPGPDHRASLEPAAFAEMVRGIREIEAALGDGMKVPAASELPNRDLVRRSLCAAADLEEGHTLRASDFVALRPASGLPPTMAVPLTGRKLRRRVSAGTMIELADLA
jgi:N-acetylneuraminate synthase/N,N'-diacetyllegionaminate synthase